MKNIICFGEALIDFLHVGQTKQDSISLKEFRQYPGGAPANAAVAVAKLGGAAQFAGQVGSDSFGDFLKSSLESYAVDTRWMLQHPSAKTALAFVSRDEHGERSFEFYRHQTADVVFQLEQASPEWFLDEPIFHICSNTLTADGIAETTIKLVEQAKSYGATISFDVNLRANLWPENKIDIALVNKLAKTCDVIKFSREEIEELSRGQVGSYIAELIENSVKFILVTDGSEATEYFTSNFKGTIQPPRVAAIDTNASGDTFIGGVLRCLAEVQDLNHLVCGQQALVEAIIRFASHCSAHTVTREGAFTAMPLLTDVEQHWPWAADNT